MRSLVVVCIVIGALATGLRWGTYAVGGSDSYCYAHQAERWASGRLQVPEPLALEAPWPDAPLAFAPGGHIPSPTVPGAIVPICPPGLSVAMAPFLAVAGARGIFLVVPLFGALLVAATYVVGSRFGPRVGLASAVLATCSPAFLFQVIQPMSDVPAAALWLLAVACATSTKRRGPLAAGLVASAAILMRPNLVPLGLTIGLFLAFRPERTWRARGAAAAIFGAACVPGCLAVAMIQWTFHGSPLRSGYGALDGLFAFAHVAPNAQRYASWLWQTHSPLLLLAVVAPIVLPGWLSRLLATLVLVTLACYLPYTVFDDWWYLRFLLPAIPLLLVLTVATIDALAQRATRHSAPRRAAVWTLAVVTAFLAVTLIREARARQVFDLARLESRFARAGEFVARRLPDNALVVTSWESGSVRFYSGRRTLVWDGLDPAWLDRALDFARERGLEPYLLFESWEEPIFRRRFTSSALGALDWPPIAEVASQVRIYRPGDRERYFKGEALPTEYSR
ncbi:MAG: glycosyltransferase family 39 protein [Vicinamibacterales bacterium]